MSLVPRLHGLNLKFEFCTKYFAHIRSAQQLAGILLIRVILKFARVFPLRLTVSKLVFTD